MEPTTVEILEKIHNFYSSGFGHLLVYTVALLALVGGLIPIVISILQSRTFRRETQAITTELNRHAETIRSELKADSIKISDDIKGGIKSELGQEITELEKRLIDLVTRTETNLNKKLERADGGVFHVQGLIGVEGRRYATSLLSFATAAQRYLLAEDERNLRTVLENIQGLFNEVNKDDLKNEPSIEPSIESLVKSLNSNNINGRYENDIERLRKGLSDIKERARNKTGGQNGNK